MTTSASREPRYDWLPAVWLSLDEHGRIVDCNAAAVTLLGAESELLAAQFATLLDGSARVLYESYLYPVLKLAGQLKSTELAVHGRDGQLVDVLLSAQLDRDLGNVHVILVPIVQQRRLQEQLVLARHVVEQVPGLLFQIARDRNGKLSMPYASEALRELYEVDPRDVTGDLDAWFAVMSSEDAEQTRRSLSAVSGVQGDTAIRLNHCITRGQQVRRIAGDAEAQWKPSGEVLIHGYLSDITEQFAAANALKDKKAAELASRQKTHLLARVSHELRTPVNSILGFAQILMFERDKLDATVRAKVAHIEHAARDLVALIDDILDVSRLEVKEVKLSLVDVPLVELVEHVVQLVMPLAERNQVRFAVSVPRELAVYADAQRVQQVVLNLVSNAVKYNRPGGLVRIVASRVGERANLSVADEGPGFSAQQQQQLYQPFNRLGAELTSTEGSGLGLVIARGLVERMGGTLVLSSVPGRGAEFAFALPAVLHEHALRPDVVRVSTSAPASTQQKRVLYVEDNPLNIALIRAIFAMRPELELSIAETAELAMSSVAALMPDLLLIDMHLPDAHGDELLSRLRATHGLQLPRAIAVSADAIPTDIVAALAKGFDDYWTKPLDVRQLLKRLDALLADDHGPHEPA